MYSLTPQQDQVLALISAGSTISGAASSAGIHRNTVHNWMHSVPLFRTALSHAHHAKAMYWREEAEQLAAAALDTIRATMEDASAPPSVRLKAAQSILALATTPPPKPPAADLLDLVPPPVSGEPAPAPASEIVHNSAQSSPEPLHTFHRAFPKIGRNDPCPCRSGRKFKHCCLNKSGDPPLTPDLVPDSPHSAN
jgi:hypothetical protein